MKKAVVILLLAIHFFNVVGYRLYISIIEDRADNQMISLLDNNNYDDSELMQVKIPLHLPYLQSSNNYERFDGELEHNGVQYNYVKRMVKNDTLFLYCIPNQQKTELTHTKNLFAKQSTDNSSPKKTELPSMKKFYSDFQIGVSRNEFNVLELQSVVFNTAFHSTILKGFITKHLQPPDLFI